LNLGDKVKKQIYTGPEGGSLLPAEIGTVVYIHPEGRFYTLEFKFERHGQVGTVRESYLFPAPRQDVPVGPRAQRRGGAGGRGPAGRVFEAYLTAPH